MKKPHLHSGVTIDRPETTELPPIPEVVWQQPQETLLIDIHSKSTNNNKRKNDVEAQTSPIEKTSSQVSGTDTEPLLKNQLGARQYNGPMTPRNNKMKSKQRKLT